MSRRSRENQYDVDALQVALEFANQGNPTGDARVEIARRLRGGVEPSESQRTRTRARMLRAFDDEQHARGGAPAVVAGGNLDALGNVVHTAEVETPDGGTVRLADIEHITPEDAARVAAQIVDDLTRQSVEGRDL